MHAVAGQGVAMLTFKWSALCLNLRGSVSQSEDVTVILGRMFLILGRIQMIFKKPGLQMWFKLKLVSFTHPQWDEVNEVWFMVSSVAGNLWILCLRFTSAGDSDVWVSVGTLVNRLSGPQHSHLRLMTASIAGRWRGFNASPLAPQKWR